MSKKKKDITIKEINDLGNGDWHAVIEINGREYDDRFNAGGAEITLKRLSKTSAMYKFFATALAEINKIKTKEHKDADYNN